ncbi:MAG: GxxExxY protein [Alphaproteobacteria bacterium]|nr:GxxExxY protein [Alphaproteobacteria bacterium]
MNSLNHQDTKTPRLYEPVEVNQDLLGKQIVDCAFQVHKELGPGLLENIYEEAFTCELKDRNIVFEQQKPISIRYKNHELATSYRLDLLIEGQIIVELKCVDRLLPVHEAQILTYLRLRKLRLGYLINFNTPLIKDGIKRKVL